MRPFSIAEHLAWFGPQATEPRRLSLRQSRRYCRQLARHHYENFTVVSWLVPRSMRQHLYNIYAWCRWADDLADETVGPGASLPLLAWWQSQLRECYDGRAEHPVLVALGETIRQFAIPPEPFVDLLTAFRRDQRATRYETFDELLDYCRHSANPVGRLVLYVVRCHTPEHVRLSDSICTGLQLANFWQDVSRDWERGRVYLPQADCRRFGVDVNTFPQRQPTENFRRLLAAEVAEAEAFLRRGWPLVGLMPPGMQPDVALFIEGGLAILDAIRRQQYDVWSRRPTLSGWDKLRLLARCWWRLHRQPIPGPP